MRKIHYTLKSGQNSVPMIIIWRPSGEIEDSPEAFCAFWENYGEQWLQRAHIQIAEAPHRIQSHTFLAIYEGDPAVERAVEIVNVGGIYPISLCIGSVVLKMTHRLEASALSSPGDLPALPNWLLKEIGAAPPEKKLSIAPTARIDYNEELAQWRLLQYLVLNRYRFLQEIGPQRRNYAPYHQAALKEEPGIRFEQPLTMREFGRSALRTHLRVTLWNYLKQSGVEVTGLDDPKIDSFAQATVRSGQPPRTLEHSLLGGFTYPDFVVQPHGNNVEIALELKAPRRSRACNKYTIEKYLSDYWGNVRKQIESRRALNSNFYQVLVFDITELDQSLDDCLRALGEVQAPEGLAAVQFFMRPEDEPLHGFLSPWFWPGKWTQKPSFYGQANFYCPLWQRGQWGLPLDWRLEPAPTRTISPGQSESAATPDISRWLLLLNQNQKQAIDNKLRAMNPVAAPSAPGSKRKLCALEPKSDHAAMAPNVSAPSTWKQLKTATASASTQRSRGPIVASKPASRPESHTKEKRLGSRASEVGSVHRDVAGVFVASVMAAEPFLSQEPLVCVFEGNGYYHKDECGVVSMAREKVVRVKESEALNRRKVRCPFCW